MDSAEGLNNIEQRLVDKARQALIPIITGFELTPYCNFKCDMCYVRKDSEQQSVSSCRVLALEQWKEISLQFKALGGYFITLTGGEPLLYPHFKELYTFLTHQGFSLRVNTNGYLIDEEYANLFGTFRPRRINLTFYGASNKTYQDLCHVEGGYDHFMYAVKLLRERNVDICLNFTQVQKNQADFHEMFSWAKSENIPVQIAHYIAVPCRDYVDGKNILNIRNTPRIAAENDLVYKKYKLGEEKYSLWEKDLREYLQSPYYPEIDGCDLFCNAAKCSCWVNWQGELQPCVDLMSPAFDLKSMSFSDAWEGLVQASENFPVHAECKNCKLKPLCNICYARAVNEKANCGSIDYICETTRSKAELLIGGITD